MKKFLILALYIAVTAALIPAWNYFAIRETVVVMYPQGYSEDAMVAVATTVSRLPVFIWAASLLVVVFKLVKDVCNG